MYLPLIYQDEDYIVIDKPAGLLVHRTQLDTHATEFAVQTLRDQIGREVFPCHRLDRPTSGILLFALNQKAHRFAQNEFAQHQTEKEYHAVVRGWTDDTGEIDYDLRSEEIPGRSQSAQTKYSCLARSQLEISVGRYTSARFSLLKLNPITGRKHQLRRHLAHIRHPIIGDTRHGDGVQNRFARESAGVHRLLLRATRLEIGIPCAPHRLYLAASEEPEFEQALKALNLFR
jgi:tRNA pseudouridine65 synthase